MTTDTNAPGTAWMQIVKKNGTSDFAASFTADARLQASALSKAVVGPTLIGAFFAATSKMYEHIEFTAETVDGVKTYLEWDGIYQSPFDVVREFSSGLKERLEGTLGQDFFS